ncbi:hypothetical protein HYC85_011484 [Camellia sinensis]|uniref:Uncharacterized protein n=1 Tax=Camellia sinensis TaxID=4442 RepID=A0A7J7HB53_CAMSI|nr:hypothetical protein HYC85_011484 [Camellia sinensis]
MADLLGLVLPHHSLRALFWESPPMVSILAIHEAGVLHVVGTSNLQWGSLHLCQLCEKYHVSSSIPEGQRKALQMLSLDARKPVERFIENYGPDAFDRVIKAAEKEAKKSKEIK